MASSFGAWSDLPPELLRVIVDSPSLPLQSLSAIRGVCTAWRAALPPPSFPLLLAVSCFDDAPLHGQLDAGARVSALPLLLLPRADRAYELSTLPVGGEFVGACHGWVAVNTVWPGIFLVNPLAGEGREIGLPALRNFVDDGEPVRKVVFAPRPAPDDCTAVAICGPSTLAYTRTRDMKRWVMVDVAVEAPDRLADMAYDAAGGKVYLVTRCGDVHVFQIPRDRRRLRPRAHPLQPGRRAGGDAFKPAAAFAPPYDVASRYVITRSKNVFICGGVLYQVWRRDAATAISWTAPGGGGGTFRMPKDDVVVLKYHKARRRPCWDAVSDLGGCSVFVGKNNPVVLRPEDAPGVRANCVYWINEQAEPMVFDMAARTSTRHPSSAKVLTPACRPLCWYFLQEKTMSVEDN